MSLKTGHSNLYVGAFPPKKAKRLAGVGKIKGTGRGVKTPNPPKVKTVSTSQYRQKKGGY